MSKNMQMNIRYLLPISILILIFLELTISLISNQYFKSQSLKELHCGVTLATYISKALHETQKERGMSSGLLASNGRKFKSDLIIQRIATDKALKNLKSYVMITTDKDVVNSLKIAFQELKNLQNIRESVDTLKLKVSEAIRSYSKINEQLLHVVIKIAKISKEQKIMYSLTAYSNFLYAKENAGIERAVGTGILSQNRFLNEQRVFFTNLITIQKLYLKNFLEYASEDAKHFYTKVFQGKEIAEVERIRGVILHTKETEGFGIEAKYWFHNITVKIDKLKQIDDYLEKELRLDIQGELNTAYMLFGGYTFINILSTFIFIIIIIFVVRLIKSEKRLKALNDKYIIGSTTDLKGNIIDVSEAFCDISGYTKEELIGKPHNVIRHPDMPKSAFKHLWETIKKGEVWQGEVKNLKKDGGYYWVYANVEPLFDKKGNIESYAAIRLDITDSIHLSEELQKSKESDKVMLQQSKLAQMGEMISMIAHQWRQPLAAISSLSTAMELKSKLGTLDNESIAKLSHTITQHSKHLSETIDDFRCFFKPNKEKIETNFNEIVQNVLSIVETSINTKNIKIIQELNCNKNFSSYPNELKQVILNLLKNAEDVLIENKIKDPYIKIRSFSEENSYILQVSDNAGGISEDIIEKIFDPYFSTKTKKDGTGLGLYMSKTIIQEHCQGILHVSNDKEGAVFEIRLSNNGSEDVIS